MNAETRLSSKGQVVIPKDIRKALNLRPGSVLAVSREGSQIVFEEHDPDGERISYEEFRRRIPAYDGPKVELRDMKVKPNDDYRDQSSDD